jgi:glycosyltransferase involved in cell wall biosynthesis
MSFPKILIVGKYFNKKAGDKTIINLFKQWDIKNIAVACENINYPDFDVCNNYYNLGSLFNLIFWKQKNQSGVLSEKEQNSSYKLPPNKDSKFRTFYNYLIRSTGLNSYKHRYKISNDFLIWIEEFSPDYIYSQLSNLELILLVSNLHKKTQIPIAIHIMDDWPATIGKEGIFQSYWHKRITYSFRKLLSKTSVFMSISEAMSDEYQCRYGYKFIPFHNPIDINFWGKESKNNYEVNTSFNILYAGRIGTGIRSCFIDIAYAISSLVQKGLKIELHIQATNYDAILDDLSKFDFVKFNKMVAYNKLPKIFSESDLLLLPNDFDKKSASFLKYSMPTKASEYMASGTPILLYASPDAAVTMHALNYKWAYVVSEKNNEMIEKAITEIYKKKELRIQLGTTAKEFAQRQYDGNKVREQFRKAFTLN